MRQGYGLWLTAPRKGRGPDLERNTLQDKGVFSTFRLIPVGSTSYAIFDDVLPTNIFDGYRLYRQTYSLLCLHMYVE